MKEAKADALIFYFKIKYNKNLSISQVSRYLLLINKSINNINRKLGVHKLDLTKDFKPLVLEISNSKL